MTALLLAKPGTTAVTVHCCACQSDGDIPVTLTRHGRQVLVAIDDDRARAWASSHRGPFTIGER